MKIEVFGWVKGGVLELAKRTRERMAGDLKAFEDCDVTIIIKKRGKRSSQQNRYYWGVVVDEVRRELKRRGTRATANEVHDALKAKFNPANVCDKDGVVLLEIGGSTTEMNKSEFGEYIDRIIEWAANSLEIVIPLPNEQTQLFNTAA